MHNIYTCLKTNRRPAGGRQDSEDDFSTNATNTILEVSHFLNKVVSELK